MHNHPSNLALELIKDTNQNPNSNPSIHIYWAFHLGLHFVVFPSRILQQCFESMFLSKVLRQWKEMLLVDCDCPSPYFSLNAKSTMEGALIVILGWETWRFVIVVW
jgi:hypothetical protein